MADYRRTARWILSTAFFLACLASAGAYADVQTAESWLVSQLGNDGSVVESANVHATSLQSTAEVLSLGLASLAPDRQAAARSYVLAADAGTTEVLARQIVIAAGAGLPLAGRLERLYMAQDADDGGFAELPGYQSSVLDTAYALEALAASGLLRSDAANHAAAYLLDQQKPDGSWQLNEGVLDHGAGSVAYVTARVLSALHLYRHILPVAGSVISGREWLLSNRDADGLWFDEIVSSQVLLSLIPLQTDIDGLDGAVDALTLAQKPAGDWQGDAFATALALRVSKLADQPRTNPDEIQIRGRVLDGETGLGLGGVAIAVSGAQDATVTSGVDGTFVVRDLTPGSYTISLTRTGYGELVATTTASTGSLIDLGVLRMLRSLAGSSSGVLRGVVSDATDGSAIMAARILVNGQEVAQTHFDGTYQVNDLAPGVVQIRVQADRYDDSAATATIVVGQISVFSPSLVRTPQPDPLATAVRGVFVDADTNVPLAGVLVSLIGAETTTILSVGDGTFSFSAIAAGTYQLAAHLAGYAPVTGTVSVALGEVSDFGSIRMPPQAGPVGTSGTIRGIVTDAETGEPLEGAAVELEGVASVFTGADGLYELTGVPVGTRGISASKAGYLSVSGMATLDGGGVLAFSPALHLDMQAGDVVVQGVIRDARTDAPLSGVKVIASGSNNRHTWTLADGSYRLEGAAPGQLDIATEYAGYQPVSASVSAIAGTTVLFSPLLYPDGQTPPGEANSATVLGRLVDAATGNPISGANVTIRSGASTSEVQTGSTGQFSFGGLSASEALLEFRASGYEGADYPLALLPLQEADIGDVRLRPAGVAELLPNLVVGDVDWSTLATNAQTLESSGYVAVTVVNQGNVESTASLVGIRYDDLLLGSAPIAALSAGGQGQTMLPVSGTLPFRDVPLSVVADLTEVVAESEEGDNQRARNVDCHLEDVGLPSITPTFKWSWRPGSSTIVSSPAVGPLVDTNGDGRVDTSDTTYVIAVAGNGVDGASGVIHAVRGRDKATLWTSPALTYATSHPALGDIDGDGIPEVVAFRYDGGVVALGNDGQVKWEVVLPRIDTSASNYNYNAIALSDLDGDGRSEILAYNYVLNSDGSIRTTLPYYTAIWAMPAAADLNGDGVKEIIFYGRVFDASGNVIWNSGTGAGYVAVANLDADPEPEVVFSRPTSELGAKWIFVYEHNGSLKWQAGVGSGGGAPAIGDLDGDGVPEIVVAGGTYVVAMRADGSQLWRSQSGDQSKRTGVTVSDLNGDGRSEVLYGGSNYFRVYNGPDGAVLYSASQNNSTASEAPVVADIDDDGAAEFLFIAGRTLVARQNVDDDWARTRSIWNQYGYHVTNIEDDLSIPAHERSSWQVHNTYRSNTAVPVGAAEQVDLTVGHLRLLDNGAGQPQTLLARVGNAGLAGMAAEGVARFYLGAPSAGGLQIGEVPVPALAAGAYADVSVSSTAVSSGASVFVVVEYGELIGECDTGNNEHSYAVGVANQLADVSVSVSKPVLGPNDDLLVATTVSNLGALPGDFQVRLWIADADGIVVETLADQGPVPLAADGVSELTHAWNSGAILVGDYQVIAEVYGADGALLARKSTGLRIDLDPDAAVATVTVSTDKPVYNTTDALQVEGIARNLSSNLLIRAATIHVELLDAQGQVLQTTAVSTGDLPAGSMHTYTAPLGLSAMAEGVYAVRSVLRSATGVDLAVANGAFSVARDLSRSMVGSVVAESTSTQVGDTQTCTVTLRNVGDLPVTDLQVRQLVRSLGADGGEHLVSNQAVTLAPGGSVTFSSSFSTANYATGDHACAVQYLDGPRWISTGYAVFAVTVPPVDVDVELDNAGVGRVLVLMDASSGANAASCPAVATLDLGAYLDMPTDPATTITVALKNAQGVLLDQETLSLADYRGERDLSTGSAAGNLMLLGSGEAIHAYAVGAPAGATVAAVIATPAYSINTGPLSLGCGGDPLGQGAGDPNLHVQRRYLEATLDHMGWSYLIVDNAERFDWALRNGAWSAVALMSENVQLSQATQIYLGERVAAGTGLLVAGRHDNRNALLDDFLGVWFAGKHASATGLDFAAALGDASHLDFVRADKPVRVTLNGATMLATITGAKKDAAAITEYRHGRGMALHVGHDLLAEAASNGAASGWKAVITALLNRLIPAEPIAGSAWPVTVTIANEGQPANTRVTVELPPGVAVVDASGGTIDGDWQGEAYLPAQGTKSWQLWVALPDDDGNYLLEATVQAQAGAQWLQTDQASLSVTVP